MFSSTIPDTSSSTIHEIISSTKSLRRLSMEIENPPLVGDTLTFNINAPGEIRKTLIESLVYEKNAIMLYADPGVGKSIITLNMAMQASAGLPIFGYFECPRPLKVYYILTERGYQEPLERLRIMQKKISADYSNLFLDEEMIGLNVLDPHDEQLFMNRIERYCPNPDIIVTDPIYAIVRGGLADPKDATLFAQFSARLIKRFGCCHWMNNHTTKSTGDIIGGEWKEKANPFFGSQLLYAHITACYYLKQHEGNSKITCTKDTDSSHISKLSLKFDYESFTLEMDIKNAEMTAKDKAKSFFHYCKINQKSFTFDELLKALSPATSRYTQKLLGVTISEGTITNLSPKFDKGLYRVL
jgi:RecA-family ATPase